MTYDVCEICNAKFWGDDCWKCKENELKEKK